MEASASAQVAVRACGTLTRNSGACALVTSSSVLFPANLSGHGEMVLPTAEGRIVMSSCGDPDLYLAVMVFNDEYGKCELTRAPMGHVLRLAADVYENGVCLGPTHVEGAAIRWVPFADGSLRASIHDGEVRILPYGEDRYVLLHVRRASVYPLALGTDRREIVDRVESELHSFADSPNSIAVQFRGRRLNFKATKCGDGFARCKLDDTTFIVSLEDSGADALSPNLVVERIRSGTSERVAELPYSDHLDVLWTENEEVRPGRAVPHSSRKIRPGPTWPLVSAHPTPGAANTPLSPEVKEALTGVLEHIARLGGAGISIHLQAVTMFDTLAEDGVRVVGRGATFRSAIEGGAKRAFVGKERTFRYAIAPYRVFGLVRSDGVHDVLPLDALRDLRAEYTRALLDTWSRIKASNGTASGPRSSTNSPPPPPSPPEQGSSPQPPPESPATTASDARTGMSPSVGGIPLSFASREELDPERGSSQTPVQFDQAAFIQQFVDARDEALRERERQLRSMSQARAPPGKEKT